MNDLSRRVATLTAAAKADAKLGLWRRQRTEKTRTTARDCLVHGQGAQHPLTPLRRDQDEPAMQFEHARLRQPAPRQA